MVTGAKALLPALMLVVNKAIVDLVIANWGNSALNWQPLINLVVMRFGLSLLSEILNQVNLYVSQVFNDKFVLHANYVLLKKATQLDLTHFESAEFYDTLSRAQSSGSVYPQKVVKTLTALFGQALTLVSLLGLLMRFHWAIVPLLLITSLPSFWTSVIYSGRRFWMMRRETQAGRLSEYLQQVLTNQSFAKEVRLFNLGEYLLREWRKIRHDFNHKSAAIAERYAKMRGISGIVVNFGFYFAYGWTLVRTIGGQISVGDFTMYTGTHPS